MADSYSTTSIALAAWLYTNGLEYVGCDTKQFPSVFHFQSDGNSKLKELIALWQRGEANGNCLAFYNSYQLLKAQIREGKNASHG